MTRSLFSFPPPGWSSPAIDNATLTGVGLFVATAVVSQLIQIRHVSRLQKREQDEQQKLKEQDHRQQEAAASKRQRRRRRRRRRDASRSTSCSEDRGNGNTSEEPDNNNNNIMSKQAFERRRLSRRLSIQNFEDIGTPLESSEEKEAITEWSIHQSTADLTTLFPPQPELEPLPAEAKTESSGQPRNATQPFPRNHDEGLKAAPSVNVNVTNPSVALNDRYHDFHPKYQNWRHFEHCNEHDEAKQRRKDQKQQQQHSCQQQGAGEGAAQKKDKGATKQRRFWQMRSGGAIDRTLKSIPRSRDRYSTGASFEIENNDNTANGKFNNDENSLSSVASVASEHEDVVDESFKSANSFGSNNSQHAEKEPNKKSTARDAFGPQPLDSALNVNRLAIRSGGSIESVDDIIEATGSGVSYVDDDHHADNDVGKFQRFYRMLSRSVIDDDSDHHEGSIEHVHPLSLISGPSNSSGSSHSSHSSRSSGSSSSSGGSSSSIDYDGDIEDRHRALRTEYNAQIMPEKLVLIRHGQSMGNVDETFYATTPDNAMPLTDLGWEQARKAGTILKDKIITPGESVHFIVSPYVRTVETFHGIVSAWCDPESEEFASIQDHNRKVNAWYERLTELGLTWNEDSRIREQDFGNYQNPEQTRRAKEERHRFGAFYYRFQNGESGSDVYDRVSTFLDSLWRSFETNKSQNYVLVTHGIVLRVLMARYFRYTISQLNMLANPRNCEMVVLGHAGDGRLDLEGRCSLELEEDPTTRKSRVKGYKFHKRLRIFPKSQIRTVQFRISPLDRKV